MREDVDLIIPVYRPDEKFDLLMERMDRQSCRPKHILLLHTLDEGEEETLEDRFSDMEGVRVYPVKKAEFDHGGTRAFGASLSNAEYLLYMTQDAAPADRRLVEALLCGFQDENTAAVYGRQVAQDTDGILERFTREFNYPPQDFKKSRRDLERLGIKTYFCSNVCAMYRKEIYERMGGFVKRTIFNEDMLLAAKCVRAGYSIYYAAGARVIHSHNYTYRQQFKRNFDLAVSQRQYQDILGDVKSESEGIRLVKEAARYLIRHGRIERLPDLILQSAFKYLGYRAGLRYERLPMGLIRRWSMNPGWWKGKEVS